MTRLGLLVVLIAATGLPLAAQQPAPAFEVASVRRNIDGGNTSFSPRANGQLIATNTPVRTSAARPA